MTYQTIKTMIFLVYILIVLHSYKVKYKLFMYFNNIREDSKMCEKIM